MRFLRLPIQTGVADVTEHAARGGGRVARAGAETASSLKALARADTAALLEASLPYELQAALRQQAPTKLQVSGGTAPLQYAREGELIPEGAAKAATRAAKRAMRAASPPHRTESSGGASQPERAPPTERPPPHPGREAAGVVRVLGVPRVGPRGADAGCCTCSHQRNGRSR